MLVKDKRKPDQDLVEVLTQKEFSIYIRKLRGLMIHRGNVSFSYKSVDYILSFFKENFEAGKVLALKQAIKNVRPFIGVAKARKGRKVYIVPIKLKDSRKYVLMNDWILRRWKNFGQTRGISLDRVCQLLKDAVYNNGKLLEMKDDYTDKAIDSRYVLMQKGKQRNSRSLVSFKKKIISKKKKRSLRRFFFRKNYSIYKIFRLIKSGLERNYQLKNELKSSMLKMWNSTYYDRMVFLLNWMNKNKKFLFTKKKLDLLKRKKLSIFSFWKRKIK